MFPLLRHPILFVILPFITSVHSFQVIAPGQVTVGQTATVQWIRHNGDPSSFGVLLRRNNQDHGGTIVSTVRGTSDDKGFAQFTADRDTQFLVTIIKELEINSNQVPTTLASSSTIVASKGTVSTPQTDTPANPNPNPNTSTDTSSSQTTPSPTPTINNPPQDTSNTSSGSNRGDGAGDDNGGRSTTGSSTSILTGAPSNPTSNKGGDLSSLLSGGVPDKSDTSTGLPPTRPSSTSNPPSQTETQGTPPAPPTSPPGALPSPPPKPNHTAVIVGSVLGALILLLLLLLLYIWYRRRQRKRQTQDFAFRRDLMVRPEDPAVAESGTGVSFWPASRGSSAPSPDLASVLSSSYEYGAGFTSNPRVVSWAPSGASTNLSSSPSVFYTAAPAGTTALAPGFVFPTREAPTSSALSSSGGSESTAGQTARQTAIKNKMSQLRTQLLLLQSRSARGSGDSDSVASMSGKHQQDRDEVQRIREELERLGDVLNSGWALKRLESGGDVPAGLRT